MPRQARIDIPGQVYHVMSRGIERRAIFLDDEDYTDFHQRISIWLNKSGGKCLAWCLMPNHFHFLVLRGQRPLSEMMHRVITGYALNFNLRHHRCGHLFQNRYKAIICDLEEYFLELVPYIQLNPLRARLVKDLAELEEYKWCGHRSVVRGVPDDITDREALLEHFGGNMGSALEKYKRVMAEKSAAAERPDLSGGGLLRSFGGKNSVLKIFRAGEKVFSDQRILGESDFVESVLRAAGEALEKGKKSRADLLAEVESLTGIPRQDIFRHTRERGPARARAVYCYLCREAGYAGFELAAELAMSESGVSRLASRGRLMTDTAHV